MNKNIEPVLALIKNSSRRSLGNVEYVEGLIRAFGITYEQRSAYGYDNKFMNPGGTTGIYQTPRQLAEFLVYVSKFRLKSYLEVGIFQGGTYLFNTTYLRMFNPFMTACGTDITSEYLQDDMKKHIKLHIGTSKDFSGQKFDLVFIDADHSYESVKTDFINVGQHAKFCAFHDINEVECPGVVKFWNDYKHLYPNKEFTFHSEKKQVHGIGLVRLIK